MGGRNADNVWCSIKFYKKIDLNWLLCNKSIGTHTLECDICLQLSLIIELSLLFKGLQHVAQRTCMYVDQACCRPIRADLRSSTYVHVRGFSSPVLLGVLIRMSCCVGLPINPR